MAILRNVDETLLASSSSSSFTFSDFPEDVQLCILSFLTPSEISSFSCTSKRFLSLCRSDTKLWFSMCNRRFGSKTHIKKWGNGEIQFRLLYNTLSRWENLIGFWRRSGQGNIGVAAPSLVFFEWGPSFITGSRISPSKTGTYHVIKTPFLWMGLSPLGEPVNFLDPDRRFESSGDFIKAAELGVSDSELIPASTSFIGENHVIVEENYSFASSSLEGRRIGCTKSPSFSDLRRADLGAVEDVIGVYSTSPGSLPDSLKSEIYQYFANRIKPARERASRRSRRERERQGRRKWEPEHFVKIVNCAPTPSRPLQGLWKGICDDMRLDFYLVAYDSIGGITCRRVGDVSEPFSSYSPVFWTSNTAFMDSPFSSEEKYLYDSRIHIQPLVAHNHIHGHPTIIENEVVLRILNISSSYDLVIPELTGASVDPRHVEGRIWLYKDGSFGFGFLRDNVIIDLKGIVLDNLLIDVAE